MNDIIQTIGRLRRAMPRNQDVMDVCEAAEKSVTTPRKESEPTSKPRLTRAQIQKNYRLRKKVEAPK